MVQVILRILQVERIHDQLNTRAQQVRQTLLFQCLTAGTSQALYINVKFTLMRIKYIIDPMCNLAADRVCINC
jgi:hypothetical protein